MESSIAKPGKKERVFVALLIGKTLQREILEWQKRFAEWQARLPDGQVRWLAGKNLHLTLVPPWSEEKPGAAAGALETLHQATSPFIVRFEKVTFGPDPRRPRLIWAKGKTPSGLIKLKSAVETALRKTPIKNNFRLHLTLARFRPENFSSFPSKELAEKVSWREEIKSFALMKSHLSRHGADYEVLAEIKLF